MAVAPEKGGADPEPVNHVVGRIRCVKADIQPSALDVHPLRLAADAVQVQPAQFRLFFQVNDMQKIVPRFVPVGQKGAAAVDLAALRHLDTRNRTALQQLRVVQFHTVAAGRGEAEFVQLHGTAPNTAVGVQVTVLRIQAPVLRKVGRPVPDGLHQAPLRAENIGHKAAFLPETLGNIQQRFPSFAKRGVVAVGMVVGKLEGGDEPFPLQVDDHALPLVPEQVGLPPVDGHPLQAPHQRDRVRQQPAQPCDDHLALLPAEKGLLGGQTKGKGQKNEE